MNTAPATQTVVPSIEIALNSLCNAPPHPRETVLAFVQRAVRVVEGHKQRRMLERAILDTVNELGIRALQPASYLQLALNATEEDKAVAEAAQGGVTLQ